MNTKKLSKSIRTFIRREKARIRRDVPSSEEQEKLISGLYADRQRQIGINRSHVVPSVPIGIKYLRIFLVNFLGGGTLPTCAVWGDDSPSPRLLPRPSLWQIHAN